MISHFLLYIVLKRLFYIHKQRPLISCIADILEVSDEFFEDLVFFYFLEKEGISFELHRIKFRKCLHKSILNRKNRYYSRLYE